MIKYDSNTLNYDEYDKWLDTLIWIEKNGKSKQIKWREANEYYRNDWYYDSKKNKELNNVKLKT